MDYEYHKFTPKISPNAKVVGERVLIGPFTTIEDFAFLDAGSGERAEINIGFRSKIKRGAVLQTYNGRIIIGNRVSIGEYSILTGHSELTIGDLTIIAGQCYISPANHIFDLDEIIRFQGETARGIHIGSNCWIGGNSMILDGVSIGDGCVVGAHSLVTRSMPAGMVCCGNPCQAFKKREPFIKA